MLRRVAVIVALLAVIFVAGMAVSGRMRAPVAEPDAGSASLSPAAPAAEAQASARPLPVAATGAPDFTGVASRTVSGVTNISALQIVRRPSSPFASDPFFRYFFGDADDFFGGRDRRETSLGSGVIVSADGYILTNNHVVGADTAEILVALGDKREFRGKVVGTDDWTDIALLKVEARNLPTVPWGDSSQLKVAEWVLAIGNPFQLSQTVTLGIISAVGRANVGIATYEDFIQTDAAINPGNSGGALINARGELVGINTAIYSQSGGYQGVGFAVPSNLARRVMDDLIAYGEVRRGSIGYLEVAPLTTQLAQDLGAPNLQGAVVTRMRRDSEAYAAGLRPGDVIVSFNGQSVTDPGHFLRLVSDAPIGSTARLGVIRSGESIGLRVAIEQGRRRNR
jgi:Do/DeqQ family serine protease